jgi:hypothetical protein
LPCVPKVGIAQIRLEHILQDNLNPNYTAETIILALKQGKIDVCKLLDDFLADRLDKVSKKTARLHLTAIQSYLVYHDIEIIPAKFKNKVTVPKVPRVRAQAIDAENIRTILLAAS